MSGPYKIHELNPLLPAPNVRNVTKMIFLFGKIHPVLQDLLSGQNFAFTTLVFVWNLSFDLITVFERYMSRMHKHLVAG
jgi:hypothetical protein